MMTTETTKFKLGNFELNIWTIEGEEDDNDVGAGTLTVMSRIGDGQNEAYTPEQLIYCLTRSLKAGKVIDARMMMVAAAYIHHTAAFQGKDYNDATETEA
jgi:hypothetical protein